MSKNFPEHFNQFQSSISHYQLPEAFTYPFLYEPDPLCILACHEIQHYLEEQQDWEHDFGLEVESDQAIGKMFGVLVVKTTTGEIGYLAGFSGKLANGNHHQKFVPPVFDILANDGIYRSGEREISKINDQITQLEADPTYQQHKKQHDHLKKTSEQELEEARTTLKAKQIKRDNQRSEAQKSLSDKELILLDRQLNAENKRDKSRYRELSKNWKIKMVEAKDKLASFSTEINKLKTERKEKSGILQQKIFSYYSFLNQAGKSKSLKEIFEPTAAKTPPAGAGECAAPKMLQYAFLHNLQPIAMAEFWWGQSPKSEIRQHKNFYPACRGKCKPILGHMLEGIKLQENPLTDMHTSNVALPIVYEDDYLVVINKPSGFLSVPGKEVEDSVYLRMQKQYPTATGPMIVHRLDMSTSGLMVITKTKEVHEHLQRQFAERTVKKRYESLLDGIIEAEKGSIDLPLRVDLDNRPQQLVCYEYGKKAITKWKVVERKNGQTRIHFFPLTGRTHQLRVHAAHKDGLNTPMVGDELYGTKANRLHLHAAAIEFIHPITYKSITLKVKADF